MRCGVMTRGLFEVSDAYEQNEICLTKDVTQLKDSFNVHTDKAEELNKQLLEMKKQKETVESRLLEMKKQKEIAGSKCLELKMTIVGLIQDMDHARDLNGTLKKSLQDAKVNLLSTSDEAFYRAKAQALCIMSDLNVSEMDFFKTVVDDRLIDMKEASPYAEVLKYVMTNNPSHEAQEDEHHDV